MTQDRQMRDQQILEAYEQIARSVMEIKGQQELLFQKDIPQVTRFNQFIQHMETERRLVEEISLPCRLILEHFSTFLGKPDYNLGFFVGNVEVGRGILNGFSIAEWGNVTLTLGNISMTWRDEDYHYLFYPDKVILRSCDLSKPEIKLFFNFPFKLSKLLPDFPELKDHERVKYWHPDLQDG